MSRKVRLVVTSLTTVAVVAGSLLMAPMSAQADPLPSPDAVFQAWNDSFLVASGTDTYYTNTLRSKGTARSGTWIAALNLMVAQDVYERTHSPADLKLINDSAATFLKYEKTNWTSWDGWNDDIAWMILAMLGSYRTTGNQAYLDLVTDQWNKTWNRGWTSPGGGGIWEEQSSAFSKCALSNDPIALAGVALTQITGDVTYLNKSKQIYDWVKKNLVTSSGQVNECIAFPNGANGATQLQGSDNAYNAGTFIEMANALYRATGNTMYRDDAVRTADHFMAKGIIADGGKKGSSYQYWLFKGVSDLCTDTNTCAKYDAWMRTNAARAWSMRNRANLTWNNWNAPTNDPDADAFEMNGMVGLFQELPNLGASPFSGSYELQNVGSKLKVGVSANSTSDSAAIVQNTDASDATAWTLVPVSNGYVQIKNVHSGKVLNVAGVSAKSGAPVVQFPASGLIPGNDLWLPAKNADGSYSFYNRLSHLALDVTGGSTASGAPLQQYPPNSSAGQKFTLLPRSGNGQGSAPVTTTPAPPITGSGASLKGKEAGRCLDVNGASQASGASVVLWDCDGDANQAWAPVKYWV